jgi:segregation and condensation protein B
MNLENKIESILFFKNEPLSVRELAKILSAEEEQVRSAISSLQEFYKDRGLVLVTAGEEVSFGTHPEASELIEGMQKEELSRELGRAGLETLAVVLYKGPVSRRDIDYIRGVNSGYTLRNLLVRGLVERVEEGGRGYSYKPTLKLLHHLGITKIEDLPEYGIALEKIGEFKKTEDERES